MRVSFASYHRLIDLIGVFLSVFLIFLSARQSRRQYEHRPIQAIISDILKLAHALNYLLGSA